MSSRDHKPQETPKTPTTTGESKREVASSLAQDRVELLPWRINEIKKLVKDRWEETLSEFLRGINYSINDIPYNDKEKDKEKDKEEDKEKLVSYYARMGDGETVQWLIKHFQADVNLALYGAARGGQAKLVQGLVPQEGLAPQDRKTFFGKAVEAHLRGEISIEVVEYLRRAWDISVRWGVMFASAAGNSRFLDYLISTYGQVLDGENLLSIAIEYCRNRSLLRTLTGQSAQLRHEVIIHATNRGDASLVAELINGSVISCKAGTAPVNTDALIIDIVDLIVGDLKTQHFLYSPKALKFVHELLCELDENFYVVFFNQFKQRIQHEFQSPQELEFPIDVAAIYENARNIRNIMRVTKMDFRQASIWARPEVQGFFSQSVFKDLQNNKVDKDLACLIAQNLTSLEKADCEFFWKHVKHVLFEKLRDRLVELLRFHAEKIKTSETLSANTIAWKLADRYAAIGNRQDLIVALEKDLVSAAMDAGSRKIIDKYLQELNGAAVLNAATVSGGIAKESSGQSHSAQPIEGSPVMSSTSTTTFSGFTMDSKGAEADKRLMAEFGVLPGEGNVSVAGNFNSSFHVSPNHDVSDTPPSGALPDPVPARSQDPEASVPSAAAGQEQDPPKNSR